MRKHINIPIFIPDQACPNRCVFCNQHRITGSTPYPGDLEIVNLVETWLSSVDLSQTEVQIAFFGGNFTGLPLDLMKHYLSVVQQYIITGKISGIRLSTRPDYINEDIVKILSENHVVAVELGAQSMHDDVLQKCGRGHQVKDIENASRLLKAAGMELGLQMMLGLPGDTREKSIETAKKIIDLRADTTRIYPTLVIRDTQLADWYEQGKYIPLTLEEAIAQAADVCEIFSESQTKILRVGLHASEGLVNKTDYIAGPFHPSFREMVNSEIWLRKLKNHIKDIQKDSICISIHPENINAIIGYKSSNKEWLKTQFKNIEFIQDPTIKKNSLSTL